MYLIFMQYLSILYVDKIHSSACSAFVEICRHFVGVFDKETG